MAHLVQYFALDSTVASQHGQIRLPRASEYHLRASEYILLSETVLSSATLPQFMQIFAFSISLKSRLSMRGGR